MGIGFMARIGLRASAAPSYGLFGYLARRVGGCGAAIETPEVADIERCRPSDEGAGRNNGGKPKKGGGAKGKEGGGKKGGKKRPGGGTARRRPVAAVVQRPRRRRWRRLTPTGWRCSCCGHCRRR